MFSKSYRTSSEAYADLLWKVQAEGLESSPRGLPVSELTNVMIEIQNPRQLIGVTGRDFRYAVGALEACSLVGQFHVPEAFTSRVKNFKQFERNGVQWGAYGPRIAGDLGQAVDLLRSDPDTRQCVLTIFDSGKDLNRGEPDVPCTIAVQFLIRQGYLDMRTMMRSNDLWLGFPYDIIQFFALHTAVACALAVPIGAYYHNVGSLHLYASDRQNAALTHGKKTNLKLFVPPFWEGKELGAISSRAREILLSGHPGGTEFERWLSGRLNK